MEGVDQVSSRPSQMATPKSTEPTESAVLRIREGDVITASFTGASDLNTTQKVRTDGRISLPLVGEFSVTGLTPEELEAELVEKYDSKLVSKEINVTVSSERVAYVTGAVLRPGKVLSDRPITALQAVMEAGGFDFARAVLTKVRVVRNENGTAQNYLLNLKDVLEGTSNEAFFLHDGDTVFVPERIGIF